MKKNVFINARKIYFQFILKCPILYYKNDFKAILFYII